MITHLLLKLEKKNLWKTWCKFIVEKHLEEAKATLREENLIRETNWIIETLQGDYVYYQHETESGKKKPWNESHTLNWLHAYIFGTCLSERIEGEEAIEKMEALLDSSSTNKTVGYDIKI